MPVHLTGYIRLNFVTILNGRIDFSLDKLHRLKISKLGHNPVVAVTLSGISCSSSQVLNDLIKFVAQSITNFNFAQLVLNRFPADLKLERRSLNQLVAKS